MDNLIDDIDRQILACLVEDARVSLKVLSGHIGLTSPSTAERLKRLEERGVIQGYGARVNLAALGYTLQALVRVRPLPGLLHKVDKYIQAMPECIESDKVTGEDCFVIQLVVRSISSGAVLWASSLRLQPANAVTAPSAAQPSSWRRVRQVQEWLMVVMA